MLGNEILKELTNSSIAKVNIAKIIPDRFTEKYQLITNKTKPQRKTNIICLSGSAHAIEPV